MSNVERLTKYENANFHPPKRVEFGQSCVPDERRKEEEEEEEEPHALAGL